jgi:hypothetical protein
MRRFLSRAAGYGIGFAIGDLIARRWHERRKREQTELSDRAAAMLVDLARLDAELRGLVGEELGDVVIPLASVCACSSCRARAGRP